MPAFEFELDSNGNPILPQGRPSTPPLPTLREFRIIPSPDEASLHPRAVWAFWKKYMFMDHRTYYGFLELLAAFAIVLSISAINDYGDKGFFIQKIIQSVLILAGVIPIHWYSNQRLSKHLLTKALSHIVVLCLLLILTITFQIVTLIPGSSWCEYWFSASCAAGPGGLVNLFLWLTIPVYPFAMFVIWRNSRIPARDPFLAQLPSYVGEEEEIEIDDEATLAWASVNVADGIEDDSVEPEGHVRLR